MTMPLSGLKKLIAKYAIDLIIWSLATPLAFLVRVEEAWLDYAGPIMFFVLAGMPLRAGAIYGLALYRRSWHRLGVRDLIAVAGAVVGISVLLAVLGFVFTVQTPRSIYILEPIIALLGMGGARLAVRLFFEEFSRLPIVSPADTTTKSVLIVGAGEAGTMIAREMTRHPRTGRMPIGFVDDDAQKQQERYEGLKVFGGIESIPEVLDSRKVDEVLIAMPSARGDTIRRVVDLARNRKVEHRIIPGIYELLNGEVSISQIREVNVEDLLRRDPIRLETAQIAHYLKNQVVLVTGAGGSIGSEIVRQVARFSPQRIVLVERSEGAMYTLDMELRRTQLELQWATVIADVCDANAMRCVIEQYHPDVVFHAAAYKHVPLMEMQPWRAILNNAVGTATMVDAALAGGVQRFVNVSTDKAVNPTSIMGASKRIAEMAVVGAAARARADQAFVSVRFGNVLGSNGSVIPLFKDQIRRGGPVTVTHPDMTRYFMTIPEASQLVLQAGAQAENGNVYVLDMGEPVCILDLARDLISLSGLEPGEDIEITISGMRPGEKLYEELLTAEEGTTTSSHEKIFVARKNGLDRYELSKALEKLVEASHQQNSLEIRRLLAALIPSSRVYRTDGEEEHLALKD
ncbi:MAG: nucleoside-diphosphate sugar epimerase/dehydratase [Rhodothermales bacterium]